MATKVRADEAPVVALVIVLVVIGWPVLLSGRDNVEVHVTEGGGTWTRP